MKLFFASVALCLASLIAAQKVDCPPGEMSIDGSCGKCPAGQTHDGYDACYDCDAGTFKPEVGAGSCMECPPKSFSPAAATKCKSCPDGQVLLKNKCGTCKPGTYYNQYKIRCMRCEKNTFQPYENVKESCFSCSGDTNSLRGATMCTKCPANQAIMNDGTCGSCPPGTYYNSYRTRCTKCSRNTFQPDENVRESCLSCSGDTNSDKGATMCTKCAHDEVLMRDGTCGECPDGTGFDSYSLKCTKCGFNQYSSGKGVDQYCKSCPSKYYANKGASECFQCPDGQGLIAKEGKKKGKCGKCKNGYSYDSYSAICYDCGEGYISLGGITNDCIYCEEGTEPNGDRSACI